MEEIEGFRFCHFNFFFCWVMEKAISNVENCVICYEVRFVFVFLILKEKMIGWCHFECYQVLSSEIWITWMELENHMYFGGGFLIPSFIVILE